MCFSFYKIAKRAKKKQKDPKQNCRKNKEKITMNLLKKKVLYFYRFDVLDIRKYWLKYYLYIIEICVMCMYPYEYHCTITKNSLIYSTRSPEHNPNINILLLSGQSLNESNLPEFLPSLQISSPLPLSLHPPAHSIFNITLKQSYISQGVSSLLLQGCIMYDV